MPPLAPNASAGPGGRPTGQAHDVRGTQQRLNQTSLAGLPGQQRPQQYQPTLRPAVPALEPLSTSKQHQAAPPAARQSSGGRSPLGTSRDARTAPQGAVEPSSYGHTVHSRRQTSRYSAIARQDGSFVSDKGQKGVAEPWGPPHDESDGLDEEAWAEDEEAEREEDEEPLQPSLAAELRELERRYGSANRTKSNYRSRQDRIERVAAAREALYGIRHRDADVRLLAMWREMAAADSRRRRGRFAADDAMPRRSTWHKLAPGLQQQILDERAAALREATGLSLPSGRRLYLAAPGLLCDISYGVAARLRALAARLGWGVEAAAAAIVARPLLGELTLEHLEACAAELAVWLGGQSLPVVLQRLVAEPSVAAEGPQPVIARCQALSGALQLPPAAALQLLLQQPRLMAVDPRVIPARVAAAKRVVRQAGLTAAAAAPTAMGRADGEAAAAGDVGFPLGLLLCSEERLVGCLVLLQRLLAISLPAAARLLAGQPALALQSLRALATAVDFLAAHLPLPTPPQPAPSAVEPEAAAIAATVIAPVAAVAAEPPAWQITQLDSQSRPQQLPPLLQSFLHSRRSHVLFVGGTPKDGAALASGAQPRPVQVRQQRHHQEQVAQHVRVGSSSSGSPNSSSSTSSDNCSGHGQQPNGQQQQQPHKQLPPPHVLQLVSECPGVLLLQPRTAAASLDCLTRVLAEAVEHEPAAALGRWQAARTAAVAMVCASPRLLLCRVLLPSVGEARGSGFGSGADTTVAAGTAYEQLYGNARERQTSILAWVKAVDEALWKRRLDAASLATDAPDWPTPILALPYEFETSSSAGAARVAVEIAERPRPGTTRTGISHIARPGTTRRADERVRERQEGNRRRHRGRTRARSSSNDGGGGGVGASAAVLLASAAAVGATAVPIDVGLREMELMHLFELTATPSDAAAAAAVTEAPSTEAAAPCDTMYDRLYGITTPSSAQGAAAAVGPPANAEEGEDTWRRRLRSWLWRHVLSAAPSILLLPSTRLAAAADTLCTWLGIPAELLVRFLLPAAPSPPLTPLTENAGAAAAAPPPLPSLPRQHAVLLTLPSELLNRSGYAFWAWLGGAEIAGAADVAAVLRTLPGLLYDRTTVRLCAAVLHAAVGGSFGTTEGLVGQRYEDDGAAPAEAGLPDWMMFSPPAGGDGEGYGATGLGAVAAAGAAAASLAMPTPAAGLLLLHPSQVLSEGVLRLLVRAPDARVTAAGEMPTLTTTTEELRTREARTLLTQAVEVMAEALGISQPAAAAVVLATGGAAAATVLQLSCGALDKVKEAMTRVRRGGAWRRELQRYLYGNTEYGSVDGAASVYGMCGGESLAAVSSAAWELSAVLTGYRRLARLEELEAAGMRDALSFTRALQLSEDEWAGLAGHLGLTPSSPHAAGGPDS